MRKKVKSLLNKLGFHIEPREPKTVFDMVCGMEIPIGRVKHAIVHNGGTYHFCSQSCKDHFESDSQKYAGV